MADLRRRGSSQHSPSRGHLRVGATAYPQAMLIAQQSADVDWTTILTALITSVITAFVTVGAVILTFQLTTRGARAHWERQQRREVYARAVRAFSLAGREVREYVIDPDFADSDRQDEWNLALAEVQILGDEAFIEVAERVDTDLKILKYNPEGLDAIDLVSRTRELGAELISAARISIRSSIVVGT